MRMFQLTTNECVKKIAVLEGDKGREYWNRLRDFGAGKISFEGDYNGNFFVRVNTLKPGEEVMTRMVGHADFSCAMDYVMHMLKGAIACDWNPLYQCANFRKDN